LAITVVHGKTVFSIYSFFCNLTKWVAEILTKPKFAITVAMWTMHPCKVPLAFGIKIAPLHHIPFTIPRDWHGFISVSLIAFDLH